MTASRPNLVLVTVDSLRADHCGPYDPPPDAPWTGSLTPTLDSLAGEGVVYERAIAPGPRTPSSMPVVMTGEPLRGGGVYDSWAEKRERWQARRARIRGQMERYRTLAERLQERGYATGAVTANPWTTPDTGFDAGFQEFTVVEGASQRGVLGRLVERVTGDGSWLLRWPDYYDRVTATHGALDEPYFLWVFLLDPHQPYLAPRAYREETSGLASFAANLRYARSHPYFEELPPNRHRRLAATYRDTVRSVDGFLDRLLGDLDDPTTVVHADHGEALADHGMYGHRPQLLFEENVSVPLVVHGAETGDGSGATGRVEGPTALARLPTMLADLADGEFEPSRYTSPYVRGRTEEAEREYLRARNWKYVRGGEDWRYVHGHVGRTLYDLVADPGEERNALADNPEAAELFDRLLDGRTLDIAERDALAAGAAGMATAERE